MFEEFNRRDGSEDLAWLAQMVAEQKLQTPIEVEASWHEISNIAQRLLKDNSPAKPFCILVNSTVILMKSILEFSKEFLNSMNHYSVCH